MLEPWNNSSIMPPPVNMFLCVKKVDVSALKHVCNNIIKILSKQSPLHKESALCSRFLYKYDRKFRNDIGYRSFKKVNTALKKYLALNLIRNVENFIAALPSDNDEKYLPTRQMLEYVMLRLITFSMIMLRICICAKQAAIFYLNRIKRSESHWMSLLPYALMSRLWSMAMVLVQHSSTWYSNLYPYLNKLELKGLCFLPDNYELPEDLEQMLDLKNIDNFGRFAWDNRKTIDVDVSLDDDDNDMFDNILNFINTSNKNELDEEIDEEFKPIIDEYHDQISTMASMKKIDHGEVLSRERFKMDQGEVLSRESFKVLNTLNKVTKENNTPMKQNKFKKPIEEHPDNIVKLNKELATKPVTTKENEMHSYEKVTNTASLKKFINNEEKFRNESDSRSLTDHLSLMQWHALKNSLRKLCDTHTKRKIDKTLKKIWKEKCLDYDM